MTLENDLSADEEVVADSKCRNNVVGAPTSMPLKIAGLTIDIAGDVTVGVSSPVDLVGDVTVGVASPADLAGDITVDVASSANLAGDVTAGVASSADPVSVVTAGVAFREKCGDGIVIPSYSVCDYDDCCYDGQYDDCLDYYDYDDPDGYDSFLGRMTLSCIIISMALMAVGYVVLLGALSTLMCHTGAKTESIMCHTGVIM